MRQVALPKLISEIGKSETSTLYLQNHHILEKWDKLTAWYLGNETQHEDNAKVRQVNASVI